MDATWLYFVGAGIIAGAMNAIAGGGSFITFPALVLGGLPPIAANQTNSVALLPGALSSGWGYRHRLHRFRGLSLATMAWPTLLGGCVGAALLLMTPTRVFDLVIPWLILIGAFAFAFGKRLARHTRGRVSARQLSVSLVILQCIWGLYGGYFGGAVGVMMLASWTMLGLDDVHAMNAMKVLMLAASKTAAVVVFAIFGSVRWDAAIVLGASTTVGGYIGARLADRIDAVRLRQIITVFFFLIAAAFFLKSYVYASPH